METITKNKISMKMKTVKYFSMATSLIVAIMMSSCGGNNKGGNLAWLAGICGKS